MKLKIKLMESDLAYYQKHHNLEPPRTTKKAIAESYSNSKSVSRLSTERRLSTPSQSVTKKRKSQSREKEQTTKTPKKAMNTSHQQQSQS